MLTLEIITTLLSVLLFLAFLVVCWIIYVGLKEWYGLRKIDKESAGRGVTEGGIAPFKNDVSRRALRSLLGASVKDSLQFLTNLILVIVTTLALFATINENNVLNRPYISVDVTGLKQLENGALKSKLESVRLYEKNLEFTITNNGQKPAAFKIDISNLRQLYLTRIYPQENSEGVVFPGETKKVHYVLELRNSDPFTPKEEEDLNNFSGLLQAVANGEEPFLSRIIILYDYLGQHTAQRFRTILDEKIVRNDFLESDTGRSDRLSRVWVTSSDSN